MRLLIDVHFEIAHMNAIAIMDKLGFNMHCHHGFLAHWHAICMVMNRYPMLKICKSINPKGLTMLDRWAYFKMYYLSTIIRSKSRPSWRKWTYILHSCLGEMFLKYEWNMYPSQALKMIDPLSKMWLPNFLFAL